MRKVSIIVLVSIVLHSCMADIRTVFIKKNTVTIENKNKGKQILEKAWKKQGFDKLVNHKVYSLHGSDVWKGMMGKMGKPWTDNKSELDFKFEIGTFNSQISFLDGKRKGESSGLQNWNYYEINQNGELDFGKTNKKIKFGLSAYHYFFEMIDRMKKAPVIRYAGEKEFRGEKFDLVFCTWGEESPHMEHDQYIAWINQKTGFMEYSEYSLRDNYLKVPGYKAMYGAIELKNFKEVDGIFIPHEQTVYINGIKSKKSKHIHQMIVSDFQFDTFNIKELHPNKDLKNKGKYD